MSPASYNGRVSSVPEVAELEFFDPLERNLLSYMKPNKFREDVTPFGSHASVLAVILLSRWG